MKMKGFKKLTAVLVTVGMLLAAGAVYAAVSSPADIAAGLTGKTVEDLYQERAAGKTFGAIANDAGKLEEFKSQMIEQKKVILDQRVQEEKLTQEQADEIYNAMKDNMANCDGTAKGGAIGQKFGAGFGQGRGLGQGAGIARGAGFRGGMGQGMGFGRS